MKINCNFAVHFSLINLKSDYKITDGYYWIIGLQNTETKWDNIRNQNSINILVVVSLKVQIMLQNIIHAHKYLFLCTTLFIKKKKIFIC